MEYQSHSQAEIGSSRQIPIRYFNSNYAFLFLRWPLTYFCNRISNKKIKIQLNPTVNVLSYAKHVLTYSTREGAVSAYFNPSASSSISSGVIIKNAMKSTMRHIGENLAYVFLGHLQSVLLTIFLSMLGIVIWYSLYFVQKANYYFTAMLL